MNKYAFAVGAGLMGAAAGVCGKVAAGGWPWAEAALDAPGHAAVEPDRGTRE